ncbi:AfsR/SARP family transcriptional regulator [Streptomyces sp. DSM 40750]|uniref:AfsR/SARP family transcriptional regulator n=1 Tax=Streptomyces sp. DSM 40750 TaxID=2801030 RepID=UPI00214C65D7|nr:AfsR/SARP family transcriptional regulator [Streptomyces sp. DSM 40750]UUU28350.1 AfsR/SARP family transcriptional regulator [Streptomyces sp. DSM 40750]
MGITVLGPFTATYRQSSFVPSATKPRQVLALLALQADRVVTVPTLMEEIWGEELPRSAATTLQTYILQLRRKLSATLECDADAKEVLVTRHGGYLLRAQPGRLDAQEFEKLAALGGGALEAGDDRTASKLLSQALGLWLGPALVDVKVGRVLELDVVRLEEKRMTVLEQRIDADLRLGRHGEVVPELSVLAARHPMHETFCAQLMTALYRAGGSWRALEVYQRLRSALVKELGLEPSERLRRLHQAVLSGEEITDHRSFATSHSRTAARLSDRPTAA